mgnify:CR=1 FL=1
MAKSITQLAKENATQNNPIDSLRLFLEKELKYEKAEEIAKMRFVGSNINK